MSGFNSKKKMAQDKLGRTFVYLVQHINLDCDVIEPVGVYTTEADAQEAQVHFIEDAYMVGDEDLEEYANQIEFFSQYVTIVKMELL